MCVCVCVCVSMKRRKEEGRGGEGVDLAGLAKDEMEKELLGEKDDYKEERKKKTSRTSF